VLNFNHPRIIIDTNVVLRGLTRTTSIPGMILDACSQRKIILLLSKSVLAEYRAVLYDPVLSQRFAIKPAEVELALRHLHYVAEVIERKPRRFLFPRDPQDARFIELAIAGDATHLITNNADLLALSTSHTDAGKRFRQRLPRTQALHPGDFMRAFPDLFPRHTS
jgi:uncharacterized protein